VHEDYSNPTIATLTDPASPILPANALGIRARGDSHDQLLPMALFGFGEASRRHRSLGLNEYVTPSKKMEPAVIQLIFDWLDELFMPHPERDDRVRFAKRLGLIVVISAIGVFVFGA
jgi:hypothetical protein